MLALVWLAGVAVVLGTSSARTLYDDPEYDALLVAVWAVVAGGVVAFTAYFIVGGALYLGARGLGSVGSFRRARHILGFAVAPLALSLLLVWPLQLAVFGSDIFRRGGSDDGAGAARSSMRSSWASPPGLPCCCSSACEPFTAGRGGARSPPSGWSRSS